MIRNMINRNIFIVLLLSKTINSENENSTYYCLSNDANPYTLAGTITSYRFVGGNTLPVNNASK